MTLKNDKKENSKYGKKLKKRNNNYNGMMNDVSLIWGKMKYRKLYGEEKRNL